MNTKSTPLILGSSVLLISVVLIYFLFSSNNDMDNDGVVDDKDQCPQIYGLIENNGCPNKKSPRSDNGKSIDDSNSHFEKQVDSLMNGTMVCPDIPCFNLGDGRKNIIVGKKIQFGEGNWYWYRNGNKIAINYSLCLNEYFGMLRKAIDERELVLSENSIEGDNKEEDVRGISSLDDYGKLIFIDDCYILVAGAFKYESDCKTWVKKQRSKGVVNSGYLWIPDYPSLSGRLNFATFIGPFNLEEECASALKFYPKNQKFYYCKKVSLRNGALNPDDDEIRLN